MDTETCAFSAGDMAPDLIVLSWAEDGASGLVTALESDPVAVVTTALKAGREVVLHNGAYDLVVLARHAGVQVRRYDPATTPAGYEFMDLVWESMYRDQVRDTQLKYQLMTIAEGTYKAERRHNSLGYLANKYDVATLDKSEDGWRTRYHELRDTPLADWPSDARTYAEDDARATLALYRVLGREFPWPDYYVQEESRQIRAAFALQLACAWGIKADGEAAKALRANLTASMRQWERDLLEAGLLKQVRTWAPQGGYKTAVAHAKARAEADGAKWDKAAREYYLRPNYNLSKDMEAIRGRVQDVLGPYAPLTETGQISTAKEILLDTGDDLLTKLADRSTYEKTLGFVDVLDKATGDRPFCPRWNVLMDTGRTSCGSSEDPGNLQNQPRAPGVRECYVPAQGHVYIACDYDTAELRALAQVCYSQFGFSRMREAIIAGVDIHQQVADELDWLDRQGAKPFNFGLPGGLGVNSLVKYVKSYNGTIISRAQAQEAKEAWLRTWPEMHAYFDWIGGYTRDGQMGRMRAPWSGRVRGGMTFCQAANNPFQSLVADGAKKALARVQQLCYGAIGPLAGYRVVAFVHDEIILEGPEEGAHEAAMELQKVMVEEMQAVMPDVPVAATAHLMRRWYKQAKPVWGNGRLVPWEPKGD